MSVPGDLLPESHQELDGWTADHWWEILVWGALAAVAVATLVKFANTPFVVNRDSALFQHGGWYIGQGATLYVDIWDLKPPLIYAVTTILAFLSFGNMALLHVYGIVTAVLAVAGGVVYVGRTTYSMTEDGFAAVTAALSLFVLTSIYAFPYAGIRPKYFAFLCGAAALYYAVEDRHLASGVAAALGAGFWQLGGGVAVLAVAMALQREGVRAAVRTVAGGLAVAILTVFPFVLTGTAIPLFVEVVLAPIYGVERYTLLSRLLLVVIELGWGILLIPVAAYGWVCGLREDYREYWWVAAGGGLYLLQVFLELQGAIELVLVFTFLALGVGLLAAALPRPAQRTVLTGVVVFLIVSSLYWNGSPVTPVKDRVADLQADHQIPDYEQLPPDPPGSPSMQTIYWEKLKPDNCHYRLGNKQKYFETVTGGTIEKRQCGQWPFEQTPVPWLVDALVPF